MMENNAPPKLNSNNLILELDGSPVNFLHTVHDCLNVNFPGRWIGRGLPIAWPLRSPDLTHLDFFLWSYVEDQMYSQRCNTLDEPKARITAAIANVTKDMLQRV
jgi:hypothetical protein